MLTRLSLSDVPTTGPVKVNDPVSQTGKRESRAVEEVCEPPGLGSSPPSEGAPCKVLPSDPQGPGATLLHCQDVSNWPGAKEDLKGH